MLTLALWTASEQKRLPGSDGKAWIPEPGVLNGSESEWLYRARRLHRNAVANRNPRLIFLGDSLTDNWRFHGRKVWDEYYGQRQPLNLGIWGDKTQHLLWRLTEYPIDRFDPEVVVVLIGVNNISIDPPEEIARGVEAVVATVRKQLPETRILLMGLLPAVADPRRRPAAIEHVNVLLEEWAGTRSSDVTFLNIGDAFLNENGFVRFGYLIDTVHLSRKGYRVWAETMEPTLAGLLEPAAGQPATEYTIGNTPGTEVPGAAED